MSVRSSHRYAGIGAALVIAVSGGVIALSGSPAAAAAPTDLIISEYVEGTSTNKALELYNGTDAEINLADYDVLLYNNGSTSGSRLGLTGTVAPNDTFVYASNLLANYADQTTGSGLWNGNDAIVISRGGTVIDSFGRVGEDPGSAGWGSGDVRTANATLRRDPSVCAGDTDPNDAFDPAAQWVAYPTDTFDGLGTHETSCGDETPSPSDSPTETPSGTPSESPTATPTSSPTASPTSSPTTSPTETPTPGEECAADATLIGAVQGTGASTPMQGQTVTVQGVVTGDFTAGGLNGYFVQDGGDGDDATSDGIFVYARNGAAVAPGDLVRVTGSATEYQGGTQISASNVITCASGQPLPPPVQLTLPADSATYERIEGMLVNYAQPLVINEYYNYGRYGEIVLSSKRTYQPTQLFAPGSPEARALAAENAQNRITLDDGSSRQNPDPARHPNGSEFTVENSFRGGDQLTNVTAIMDYRFDKWRLQPTVGAEFTALNPRPGVPDVTGADAPPPAPGAPTAAGAPPAPLAAGEPAAAPQAVASGAPLKVASMNVLNYFTTLNSRGATTPEEFDRQEAKIVASINAMDADVVGLLEIENNDDVALKTLVAALNDAAGTQRWAAVETGTVGTDVITTALIYNPATVAPAGAHAILDSSVDPRFIDSKNRPVIAQTFTDLASREKFTVAVNHLKSKGSDCDDIGDPLDPNGQGNCNRTRTAAAQAEADWLASDPTGSGSPHRFLVGDFNAYNKEDPIATLAGAGYTDLVPSLHGDEQYSYVFDGQVGSLDHVLASESVASMITGAADWHTNADEVPLIDYTTRFKQPAQQALYRPDAYRASDHDPVLVGFRFAVEPTPTPSPSATPSETPTVTPTPTETPTSPPSETPTASPSPTETPSETPTATPSPTETPTVTPTPSETPTAGPSPTETPTTTPSPSESPTTSPSPTQTPTVNPTPSKPPTASPSPTETPTVNPTPSETPTGAPSPTATPTGTPGETIPAVPPAEGGLTAETEGAINCPAFATPGSTITIRIFGRQPGEWVGAWLFSEPRYLGSRQISEQGTIQVTLPSDLTGAHRIAIYAANGDLIGWDTITITAEPTSPTTEPSSPTTEPTGPTTEPTSPTTEPTGPTTEPSVSTTEPTGPTTTGPTTTGPTTEPTGPTTEPTGPTTAPTTAPGDPGNSDGGNVNGPAGTGTGPLADTGGPGPWLGALGAAAALAGLALAVRRRD